MSSTQGLQAVPESWAVAQIDANQPILGSADWTYVAHYSRTGEASAGLRQERISSSERM